MLIVRSLQQARRDEALVRAVQRNDTSAVIKSLDEGASARAPDETDRSGTPFQRLIEDLKAKRDHKYSPPNPVLYMMLKHHYSQNLKKDVPTYPENAVIVRALLDHGADSNTHDFLHTSVLMMAAYNGYDATVRLLLERGADPRATSIGHATPLMAATGPCVETLIAHGADLHQALLASASRGDVVGVETLLRHGADVNEVSTTPGGGNTTPLMLAALSSAETVRILLAHGAKADAQDIDGNTPLMIAVRQDNPDAVQALLAAGANYKLKNRDGDTALQIAIKWQKWRKPTSLALLRKAGAKE